MGNPHEQGTPEWWVTRMHAKLAARRELTDLWEAYYAGEHPLPWLAPQARDEFRRILKMTRTNYMGLVCDAPAEREVIEGFRVGDAPETDAALWAMWQANDLDSLSDQAILEAHIDGMAYMLVEVNRDNPERPHAWMEHASQAIVEYAPGNRRERAAGYKEWLDDWTGETHAILWIDGATCKFKAAKVADGGVPQWQRREVAGEDWGGVNPLGVVPLVEIPNRPRLLRGGVSELADVTCIQDRINKTVADRLMTQDFGAFPVNWARAWPLTDEDGNPTPPIEIGRNRMIVTDSEKADFGQFSAAPLDPYSMAKREDVKDIASRTRTPAQYLLGEMNNVNGETLKASESGLVSKVQQSCRTLGEGFEEGARLMLRAAGRDVAGLDMETVWRDPRYRTEGERTDAVIKQFQGGLIPRRKALEVLGYSQSEVAMILDELDREATDPATLAYLQGARRDAGNGAAVLPDAGASGSAGDGGSPPGQLHS